MRQRYSLIKSLYYFPLLLLLLSACSHQELLSIPQKAEYFVVDNEGKRLDSTMFNRQLKMADVIYLGETHDNADHHAAQLDIIKKIIDSGKKPVIGFEFFSRQQSSWLLNFTSNNKHSFRPLKKEHAGTLLRQRLGWNDRTDWPYYFPFIELAKEHGLQVFGADLDKGIRIRITRAGVEEMSAIEKSEVPEVYAEDSAEYQKLIFEDLRAGHCNMASDKLIKKLYKTISIRNAFMAQSIHMVQKNLEQQQPVVMILGRGHVNYNGGLVTQLNYLNDKLKQLNIGLYEAKEESADGYISALIKPVNGLEKHNLWAFTPDQHKQPVDYCEAFRK